MTADAARTALAVADLRIVHIAYPLVGGGSDVLMAGKTIPHARHGVVFLHAFHGSQWHGQSDCPCPVDTLLVDWLRGAGIKLFYAHATRQRALFRAEVAALAAAPVQQFAAQRVRQRHMLPAASWARLDNLIERRDRGTTWLLEDCGAGVLRPVLGIPFLPESSTIVLSDEDSF